MYKKYSLYHHGDTYLHDTICDPLWWPVDMKRVIQLLLHLAGGMEPYLQSATISEFLGYQ